MNFDLKASLRNEIIFVLMVSNNKIVHCPNEVKFYKEHIGSIRYIFVVLTYHKPVLNGFDQQFEAFVVNSKFGNAEKRALARWFEAIMQPLCYAPLPYFWRLLFWLLTNQELIGFGCNDNRQTKFFFSIRKMFWCQREKVKLCVLGFIAFAKEGGVAWYTNKPLRWWGWGGMWKREKAEREGEWGGGGKESPKGVSIRRRLPANERLMLLEGGFMDLFDDFETSEKFDEKKLELFWKVFLQSASSDRKKVIAIAVKSDLNLKHIYIYSFIS